MRGPKSGQGKGAQQLLAASASILFSPAVTRPQGVSGLARRAVRDVDEPNALPATQVRSGANDLVVGVGGHNEQGRGSEPVEERFKRSWRVACIQVPCS